MVIWQWYCQCQDLQSACCCNPSLRSILLLVPFTSPIDKRCAAGSSLLIAELDTPDYMVTFSGIICTLLTLQLSEEQVNHFWQISELTKPRWTLLSRRWWMPSIFPTTSEASCLTSIYQRLAQIAPQKKLFVEFHRFDWPQLRSTWGCWRRASFSWTPWARLSSSSMLSSGRWVVVASLLFKIARTSSFVQLIVHIFLLSPVTNSHTHKSHGEELMPQFSILLASKVLAWNCTGICPHWCRHFPRSGSQPTGLHFHGLR